MANERENDDKLFLEAAERLRGQAAEARVDPLRFLHAGISGRSADYSVQVWVNALGQVQRASIRPGTVIEGDEARLAEAFTEAAAAAARRAAELFTPDSIKARIKELDGKPDVAPAPRNPDEW